MSVLKIATTIVMYQCFAYVAGKTREKNWSILCVSSSQITS